MATLEEMRAERDKLNIQIREAELNAAREWNAALTTVTFALADWLATSGVEYTVSERKNEETWDIGHGALEVTFGTDGEQWARGLRAVSGKTLTLEWREVPAPERFLSIVAALLGEK